MHSITKFSKISLLKLKKFLKIVKDLVKKRSLNEVDLSQALQNQMKTRRKRKINKRNETNLDKRKKINSQKNKFLISLKSKNNNKARSLPFDKKFQTYLFTKFCFFIWEERKAVSS
jgi:hypothetical protein